ncbi:hypothetical protein PVAND_009013 [Polypedilum vanderplanki]|uniref:TIL domain-containing protein n=1 Tax=Polypedilum vanderplanki TaxID=319348 RepID=A0A9J6CC62_POLVA|nr:hypothetical protein PVAND_009013 [Polypedilum vanderplanki]
MKLIGILILCLFMTATLGFSTSKRACTKKNEIYNTCGTACPETCEYKPTICTMQCIEGCFCKRNYIRNNNGECILKKDCP